MYSAIINHDTSHSKEETAGLANIQDAGRCLKNGWIDVPQAIFQSVEPYRCQSPKHSKGMQRDSHEFPFEHWTSLSVELAKGFHLFGFPRSKFQRGPSVECGSTRTVTVPETPHGGCGGSLSSPQCEGAQLVQRSRDETSTASGARLGIFPQVHQD